jgi:formate dehydrogenase maturation protein FdhE
MTKPENKKVKAYQCSYCNGWIKRYYLEKPTWAFDDIRRVFVKIKQLDL